MRSGKSYIVVLSIVTMVVLAGCGVGSSPSLGTPTQTAEGTAVPVAKAAGAVAGNELPDDDRGGSEATTAEAPAAMEAVGADSDLRRTFDVDFNQFRQLLPRDAIFPFYEPTFVDADSADLDDGELVIAVEINGESRAYPVGPLNFREMVNDVVGGVPILVSW